MKVTEMTQEGGVVDRVEQGRTCGRWDIHAILEVKVAVVEGPIFEGRAREEGGPVDFFLGNKQRTLTRMLSRQLLLPPRIEH